MSTNGWNRRESGYDTSDVHEVLARLTPGQPPGGADISIARPSASTQESGFFNRLLEEHFTNSPYPKLLKDVTKSLFGMPSQEDTITWGQVADLSIPAGVVSAALAATLSQNQPQMVHVHRGHPTTFTILTIVDFGAGWTGSATENVGIEVDYLIGVGQVKVTLKRVLPVLSGTALNKGSQQVDTFIAPLAALQSTARIYDLALDGAETPQRAINVTTLVAPTVH